MIRTVARWYLIALGVIVSVGSFKALPAVLPPAYSSAMQEGVAITAGVLLVIGGLAGLMRLPGRVPAAYLGIGTGLAALGQLAGSLSGQPGLAPFAVGVYVALALLVIASWSLWPSTG